MVKSDFLAGLKFLRTALTQKRNEFIDLTFGAIVIRKGPERRETFGQNENGQQKPINIPNHSL